MSIYAKHSRVHYYRYYIIIVTRAYHWIKARPIIRWLYLLLIFTGTSSDEHTCNTTCLIYYCYYSAPKLHKYQDPDVDNFFSTKRLNEYVSIKHIFLIITTLFYYFVLFFWLFKIILNNIFTYQRKCHEVIKYLILIKIYFHLLYWIVYNYFYVKISYLERFIRLIINNCNIVTVLININYMKKGM